ncbi:uncharacterized protein [Littorina saxatilis]|uniref:uncharacterized protein isoform X3 n=1 Tax=Littorina saxatilis TaxID=31220 RepID=UPI0038B53637
MSKDIEDILKEFIGHVSDLKTEDDPAGTGFHREFRSLREIQTQNKSEDTFPTEDGKKEENVKKNRYKDILPRDDKRVKLTEIPGEKGSDYINATFIEDVHGQNGYIAAQGPMPHTVNDFWRMLWEQNTEIVFMACRMKEDGRAKCEKYWGDNGESATFGEITVYTLSEEEIQEHFIKRDLRAEKKGQKHHLVQFHYTGWPDHNTPSSPDALRCMIEEVRDFRKKMKVPMVVHCSAGCGRTGTICAIDHAWTLLDKGMIEEGFSMFEIIKSLREQRMSMVQTPDQYEYTHMVMKSLCDEWLVSFATRDYENVTIGPPPTEFAPEPPEEVYNNIEMNGNKNDDRDSTGSGSNTVVFLKEGKKENSKSDISHKPAIKQQKPEIHRQKPQIAATAPPSTPAARPKTMFMESFKGLEEAGEYVEVRSTASVPPVVSPTSPPSLPTKKNPPPNTAPLNPTAPADNFDPHKTVIKLGGGNTRPEILKSGSVGVSHTKQQAPRPPASHVVKPLTTADQQPRALSDQMFPPAAKMSAGRQASVPGNYENYQLPVYNNTVFPDQSMAYYANNVPAMAATPTEDGPALPDRLYKPEEAKTDQREKHNYDNVERTTTQPTKSSSSSSSSSSQTSSPTSTLPHSQGQTRALQAIPKNQNPPASVPVQVVKIPGATGGGHGTQGWVTAMGGLPPERAIPTRRVSEKSRGHPTQPTGPTVVKTTQSKPGLLKRLKPNKKPRGPPGPSQPVAAPVPPPGGVHISKSGKKIVSQAEFYRAKPGFFL